MQIVNSKKSFQKVVPKASRLKLRAVAKNAGIPEFMLRFAQERHLKIFSEQFVPKYRHD